MQTSKRPDLIEIKQAVIVEGKYDKNKIMQIYDGIVVETDGFGIFKNEEKKKYIRMLASTCGIIILTDSDNAGFIIRNYVKDICSCGDIQHAYIPDAYGKEKRKTQMSSEGKIGVEGTPDSVIVAAVSACTGTQYSKEAENEITKADLYDLGLIGMPDSKKKRAELLKRLDLPENLSTNALVMVLKRFDKKDMI